MSEPFYDDPLEELPEEDFTIILVELPDGSYGLPVLEEPYFDEEVDNT